MLGAISKISDSVAGDIRVCTKGTNVNLRSEPNTTSKIVDTVAASGTEVGKYAKYYANDGGYKRYEFSGGKYGAGWIRNDLATLTAVASAPKNDDEEAQQLLDEIVAQDKETMNNLNSAAALIETLKSKGVSTASSANKLTTIFARLQERQEAMKKTTWGKVKDTISSAWGSVKDFFGMSGLGILPIVVVGVIAIAVGAGATALVLIKPWKNQSNIDLKESKELKALLESADPVVAEKIREDIKSQLVDAYTTGNRQGSISGFMSIGKYVLIAGAALWLAPKLMNLFGGKR
jgi:hypothetical protein